MKRILIALTALLLLPTITGCATAKAETIKPEFNAVDDTPQAVDNWKTVWAERIAQAFGVFDTAAATTVDEATEEYEEWEYSSYYDYGYVDYGDSYTPTYPGGSTATTLDALLNGQGRAYDENGQDYTWYPHEIGNGPVDVPGEWFDESGVSHDVDGYIVVATDSYANGTVLESPYGDMRVYDSGCGSTIDVYTNR